MAVASLPAPQPYSAWLASKGLTSTAANAAKWKATVGQPTAPRTPRGAPAPYSYAAQVAADPLSIPFDSSMLWQGRGRPNLAHLTTQGYDHLTPVQRPDGGWAVFGLPTDPTPQWIKDQAQQITDRGAKTQQFAQQQVAPWLTQTLTALGNIQGQAQTNFANLVGQHSADLAQAASQAGPGAAQQGSAYMAPFQAHQGLLNSTAASQAQAQTQGAAYQGALNTLQTGDTGQALASSFAQQVAQMPDQWEQQRQAFMRQMDPVIQSIANARAAGEQNRLNALQQRDQFNQNLALEREVTGVKAKASEQVAQTRAQAQATHDATVAQTAADKAALANYRTVAQITNDVGRGDNLLDNHGAGFSGRPAATKFHGKTVTWEQAQNGKWYGIARAGKGSGSGSGAGGDTIFTKSTTRQRLANDLLHHWEGTTTTSPAGTTQPSEPGWSSLHRGNTGSVNPAARQVALWVLGNKQFLTRNGKLNDGDVRDFIQSVIPDVDYRWVRYYIDVLSAGGDHVG